MYRVVKNFYDLKDGNHYYRIGDEFPVKGSKASDARLAELAGNKNKLGMPVIVEVQEPSKKRKRSE